MQLVEVLIEYGVRSLDRPFSYLYNLKKPIGKGFRVLLTFNNKKLIGYVLNIKETSESKDEIESRLGFNINYIDDVIDETPLLNDELLKLAEEISEYYVSPLIKTLQIMLPPSLKPSISALNKPKIAYDFYLKVIDESEIGLTAKQIEILILIKEEKEILKRECPSISVVNKLLDLKRIEVIKKEKRRLEIPYYEDYKKPVLTKDQNLIVDEVINSDESIFLLEGVTGSGKTEVYLSLSEYYLKRNKSVLMLVPEISLTPMMMEIFIKRFKDNVAILHSGLTAGEKYDEYRKIAKGETKVVIGARSAIFAPLSNIGLIILDEEHSESYKNEFDPHYHAREVAKMRLNHFEGKLILGSATPSLESRARASKNIYHFLRLVKRVNNMPLPETIIVNLGDYQNIDRDSFIFSKQLRKSIEETLNRHEQIILLINRRGFSSSVICRKCGHVFRCPDCGIPLTYHYKENMLKCHHCGYVEILEDSCPQCGSKYFMKSGFGTERIEDEIHNLFPTARVLRLDSDAAKIRERVKKTIQSFANLEADILIGTQMVAKGHDFPNVTLVGVVLADIGLSIPSFRSSEATFQLITQAVGRCGRKDKPGKAIIQTYQPNQNAIIYGAKQDYEGFYKEEMNVRRLAKYPPYTFITLLTISHKNNDILKDASIDIVSIIKEKFKGEATVLGPTNPYISKQGDVYKKLIYVKYRDKRLASQIFKELIERYTSVDIDLDIDSFDA